MTSRSVRRCSDTGSFFASISSTAPLNRYRTANNTRRTRRRLLSDKGEHGPDKDMVLDTQQHRVTRILTAKLSRVALCSLVVMADDRWPCLKIFEQLDGGELKITVKTRAIITNFGSSTRYPDDVLRLTLSYPSVGKMAEKNETVGLTYNEFCCGATSLCQWASNNNNINNKITT